MPALFPPLGLLLVHPGETVPGAQSQDSRAGQRRTEKRSGANKDTSIFLVPLVLGMR